MTKVDMEVAIFKIVGTTIILAIVVLGCIGIIRKIDNWADRTNRRQAARVAQKRVYKARFPKTGDTIRLSGVEIVILKKYVWARERRYEVRLPNGSTTDILGSEIIDKKPIKPVPE